MPAHLRNDPRFERDAYIQWDRHLYRVLSFDRSRMELMAEDAMSLDWVTLGPPAARACVLVIPHHPDSKTEGDPKC